jgi:drug/metabolite transporter (DMT)-like permease
LTLCALFWAGNFVLGRAMHEAIPPIGLAFWRWSVASLLVLPFVWQPLVRQAALLRRHFGRMLVLALLGVTGFNTLVYLGLQTTTATNSVLIQSTMPVQILLFNWLLFGTSIGVRPAFSVLLSMCGVAVIIGAGNPLAPLGGQWVAGDLWILAAAAVWALYSVLLRWRPADLDPRAFLGFTLLSGWLLLTPLYWLEGALGRSMMWNPEVAMTIAYVAIFPSALAYFFWNRGVAAVGANRAGHFVHLMPLFGALLAMVFLDEVLGWQHVAGAGLIAMGILTSWHDRVPG